MGSPVDFPGPGAETSLMMAVERSRISVVRVLLEAGANINIVDAKGESVLHKALNSTEVDFKVVEAVLLRVQAETPLTQELIERLLAAGCSFPYFALLNDVDVLENLLQRGFDVNSENQEQRTALHYAALAKAFKSAKLLINRGAGVNALDTEDCDPLYYATYNLDLETMRLLLDHGVDPDPQDIENYVKVPLFACLALEEADGGHDKPVGECAELLLQYGAYPRKRQGPYELASLFAEGWSKKIFEGTRLNCLVAHQAMLDEAKGEEGNDELEAEEREEELHLTEIVELKDYYDKCRLILKATVFGTTLLVDLLDGCSDHEMKLRSRNQTFVSQMETFCAKTELKDSFPYYANVLARRIGKAARIVELENKGVLVICDILKHSYNQSYIFARQIVVYLSERDLERLCRV